MSPNDPQNCCPLCGATEVEERWPSKDYVTGKDFEAVFCAACGLGRTEPEVLQEQLTEFYPAAYYGEDGKHPTRRYPALLEFLQKRLLRSRARKIAPISPSEKECRMLDVGCGPGSVMEVFRERGFEVEGIEYSEQAAKLARSKELSVHVANLDNIANFKICTSKFDVVYLWHVLEHLREPNAMFAWISNHLTTQGILVLGVPDVRSAEATRHKGAWFHLDVPRHQTHWSLQALEHALRKHGFEVRKEYRLAPEYDLFSLIQSTLNALGFPRNALYAQLRRLPSVSKPHGKAQALWTYLAALAVSPWCVSIYVKRMLFRQGATLSLITKKT